MACSEELSDGDIAGPSGNARLERDALGEKEIPAAAYWGVHTARALENFPLTGRPPRQELITALAQVKLACARTNAELHHLAAPEAQAIVQACEELLAGNLRGEIVVDALQGGAGTSTNMNLNEVLANRAEELLGGKKGRYEHVDPLGHVNLHQSTNDVYPTAVKVAAIGLLRALEQAVAELQSAFQDCEKSFCDVLKVGRTQLQDAVPISLGAECSAWAECLSRDRWRVFKCEERLRVVNLGGTAVGTGITAPRDYIFLVVERLREVTGLGLSRSENLVDATQNADVFVEVSGILKAHAVNLFKISSDLRLLGSGPRAGFGEMLLPPVQAGSSLMPGKVNPVICEAVAQAAIQVLANDMAVTLAAQSGQLELNAFLPLLAENLLSSLSLLIRANQMFTRRCVQSLQADRAVCAANLERSLAVATALVPRLGYALAGEIAAEAHKTTRTVREVVLARGLLDQPEVDRLLSVENMTRLGHR
jgi:aspartate ammonia-lyase